VKKIFIPFLAIILVLGSNTNSSAITHPSSDVQAPGYLAKIWLKSLDGTYAEQVCSGALLTPVTVVTAAHCIFERDIVFINLGEDKKEYKVSKKIIHANYNQEDNLYDIAIIVLTESSENKALTLPPVNDKPLLRIENLYILGNGEDENGERDFRFKKSIQMDLSSNGRSFYEKFDETLQITAGRYIAEIENYSKACKGDSGAPLIASFAGIDTLLGLVSYGADDCSTAAPSVFVRIASHREFIKQALELE
jgi:secreted trypsin-like serine protease